MTKSKPEMVMCGDGKYASIVYCTVGQAFGTCAQLRRGKTVLVETDVVPLGNTGAAKTKALVAAKAVRS